jgi:hypothetical protein
VAKAGNLFATESAVLSVGEQRADRRTIFRLASPAAETAQPFRRISVSAEVRDPEDDTMSQRSIVRGSEIALLHGARAVGPVAGTENIPHRYPGSHTVVVEIGKPGKEKTE